MPLLPDEEFPSVLPLPRLCLLLSASLVLSWFMVPRQHELVERLMKDKQYERVVSMLQESTQTMSSGDLVGLHDLSSSQLESIAKLLKLTPREQLRAIFERKRGLNYDAYIHNIALAAIRFVDVLPPAEAYDLIVPNYLDAPEAMRLDLLRVIARNAHSVGQPALAGRALHQALQFPGSTWDDAQGMVESFRWSGQQEMALAGLLKWSQSGGAKLEEKQAQALRELDYTLAMECSNPSRALDVCLAALKKLPRTDPSLPDWMNRARLTALACSRTKDLLLPMITYVQSLPEAGWSLLKLREASLRNADRLKPYYSKLKDIAAWSDWESDFDTAFDAHAKLAAMGDLSSLDRCVDLQDFLGRGEECVELLQTLGDIPGRDSYKVALARMLAELGEDVKSKSLYEAWLTKHPEDRNARFEYCCLLEDMGDEHAARMALEEMLAHHPEDVPVVKKLAEARIRETDYKGALKLYQGLPPAAHDKTTLENYAMISESLDDHEALFRALHLTARFEKKPQVETYQQLAEAAGYLPDPQASINALQEGLSRLPDSAVLRIALAQDYLKLEQTGDAVATLLHKGLESNIEVVQTLLNLASEIPDPAKVLGYLRDDVEKRMELPEHSRLQLAVLNHNASRRDTAQRLFASVRENDATYHMLADARMAIHDYEEAARIVNKHIQSNPRASARDWELLGDIFAQMGRVNEAKQAYDTSIALLTADIPETASN